MQFRGCVGLRVHWLQKLGPSDYSRRLNSYQHYTSRFLVSTSWGLGFRVYTVPQIDLKSIVVVLSALYCSIGNLKRLCLGLGLRGKG